MLTADNGGGYVSTYQIIRNVCIYCYLKPVSVPYLRLCRVES